MTFRSLANLRRSALLAILLAGSCALPGRATIVFQFSYTDPTGMGLNDGSTQSLQIQQAVAYAGSMLGGMFANNAVITVSVGSYSNSSSATLASAGSPLVTPADANGNGIPGFYNNVVQTKVFTGNDLNGTSPDATAMINLAQPFQYNAAMPVTSSQYDFVSTFEHELTHALGFSSLIPQTPSASGAVYTTFDSFLTDSAGNYLIDHGTYTFNSAKVGTLTGGNNTRQATPSATGEFFGGPKARLGLNGQLIPIFSPNPYQPGSSGSHTDDNTNATFGELMNAATGTGPGPRGYSAVEMGMMMDLGYTFAVVPEPSTTVFLMIAVSGLAWVGVRRRRTDSARA